MKSITKPEPFSLARWTEIVEAAGVRPTARAAGVDHTTIHAITSGRRAPTLATIEETLAACGYRLAIVPAEKETIRESR